MKDLLEEVAENFWLNDDSMTDNDRISYVNGFGQGAKWQQEKENTANDILNYILTNDDGVGIALGYNSREMIEQHFKNIGYDR